MSSNADKTVASGWANIGSFALQSFALQSMSLIMKRKPRISVDLLVNIREQLDGALHNMETYKPIIEEELFQQFMDRYHGADEAFKELRPKAQANFKLKNLKISSVNRERALELLEISQGLHVDTLDASRDARYKQMRKNPPPQFFSQRNERSHCYPPPKSPFDDSNRIRPETSIA